MKSVIHFQHIWTEGITKYSIICLLHAWYINPLQFWWLIWYDQSNYKIIFILNKYCSLSWSETIRWNRPGISGPLMAQWPTESFLKNNTSPILVNMWITVGESKNAYLACKHSAPLSGNCQTILQLSHHLNRISWACFLSFAQTKLILCSANHRQGYWSILACGCLSIVWAYSWTDEMAFLNWNGLDKKAIFLWPWSVAAWIMVAKRGHKSRFLTTQSWIGNVPMLHLHVDFFTVPLHCPNGRQMPAIRAVQMDCHWGHWGHVSPQCNGALGNPNLYLDQPITKVQCQPADSPIAARLGLCSSLIFMKCNAV